jgi:hypothetical protein
MLNYPFDFRFTSAIVSRVAASLKDAALCQREIREIINIEKARKQHQDYIAILRYYSHIGLFIKEKHFFFV